MSPAVARTPPRLELQIAEGELTGGQMGEFCYDENGCAARRPTDRRATVGLQGPSGFAVLPPFLCQWWNTLHLEVKGNGFSGGQRLTLTLTLF